MSKWPAFWQKFLSPQTARFVLALLALGFAAVGAFILLMPTKGHADIGEAAVYAVGQLFALALMAFGYYFGSTARRDERDAGAPDPEPDFSKAEQGDTLP